ncbi:MAG: hypothetical protein JNN08_25530 [Bryobacterales bacterium]|nr:hypothetical protein [Bryobacterales bacterium]
MAENKTSPSERISSAFKQLAHASSNLDFAAKELTKTISHLEAAARRIGVQVSAWHRIAGHDEGHGSYWSRDVGWAKVGNSWCIAIRKTWGHHEAEDHDEEIWAFADAPRWMAVESAGKLPDLFETLVNRTVETTEKLKARKAEADELSVAIEAVLPEITEQLMLHKKGKK